MSAAATGRAKRRIVIASPLEPEHVRTIEAVDPERVEVAYHPELLPQPRYVADHTGEPFTRTEEQRQLWRACLAEAEILWDFPVADADGRHDLDAATRLRWIQATSTGVGAKVASLGLDKTDMLITTARGVHAGPLAEFVIMALLAHFRGLHHLEREQRAHRWVRYCGEEIAGRTVVTVGAGDLARGVAKVAKALDMRVIAVGRDPGKTRAHNHLFDTVMGTADLHRAFAQADAAVVTLPHLPATEKLIDHAALQALRRGAAFVNIGRGTVVDEVALIEALRSGQVGFAALDVTATEPLPPESPLWDMPNVLISPHSASTVRSENGKVTAIFCHNLRCYLDGRIGDMRNVLDKNQLY